jgi:hypothetical protein
VTYHVGEVEILFNHHAHNGSGDHPTFPSLGVTLTNHPHQVLRSKICDSLLPCPIYIHSAVLKHGGNLTFTGIVIKNYSEKDSELNMSFYMYSICQCNLVF